MTHPMRLPALHLLGLLGLTTACGIDCPEGQVVAADHQGTRKMCVAESDASTIDALTATSERALPIAGNSDSVAAES